MKTKFKLYLLLLAGLSFAALAPAQSTAFTYTGRLNDLGVPVNGDHEFQFGLFDSEVGGQAVTALQPTLTASVMNGLFTVRVDFGADIFVGPPRWLSVKARPVGAANFKLLTPRHEVTSSPYAIYAGRAGTLANGSVTANLLNTGGVLPNPGQFLSHNGGSFFWSDPGVAVGDIFLRNGTSAYYSAGGVGLGTNNPAPGIQLQVNGATLMTPGGSGGQIQFGTPSGETGTSIRGALNRADIRFDGSSLKLLAVGGGLVPPSENGLAIDTAGNVGVGRSLNFGNQTRQMLNLWGAGFGIGVQTADLYHRSGGGFAWHVGGVHSDASFDSGGGTTLMTLQPLGLSFGARLGQHLRLWTDDAANRYFGMGIQVGTIYVRSGGSAGDGFAWHKGGIHNDNYQDAGGGQTLMSLTEETGLFVKGNASVCALTIRGGCDVAEPFPMKEAKLEKGSVVVIDEEHPGQLKLSTQAYDQRVAGIISGANGINPGIALHQEGLLDGGQNVALSGRVYVRADATRGAIRPGDLLTTSPTPGHAMKVADHSRAQGAVLGKAMSALSDGTGMVLVLVTLQ